MRLKCTGVGRKKLGCLDQLRIALGPREEVMEIRRVHRSRLPVANLRAGATGGEVLRHGEKPPVCVDLS